MPIDARELERTRAARTGAAEAKLIHTINEPTPCPGCGYDIIGLRTDGVCPECGKPIHRKTRRVFSRFDFVDSPRSYLWSIALAGLLLTVGWSLMPVAWIVSGHINETGGATLFLLASCLWWVGVFIVTRPRPIQRTEDTDPHKEWFVPRLVARVTQACWVLFGAVGLALANGGGAGAGAGAANSLSVIGGVAFFVACFGLIAVFIVLSNLTFWACDTASSEAYRTMLWIVPFATYLATLFYGPSGGLSSVAALLPRFFTMAGLILVLATLFVIVPEVWVAWTLWGLARTGYWAVQNQLDAEERDQRLRERSAATAALGGLPPSGVDPGTLPGFTLGDADTPEGSRPKTLRTGGSARAGTIRRKRGGRDPEPPPSKINIPLG